VPRIHDVSRNSRSMRERGRKLHTSATQGQDQEPGPQGAPGVVCGPPPLASRGSPKSPPRWTSRRTLLHNHGSPRPPGTGRGGGGCRPLSYSQTRGPWERRDDSAVCGHGGGRRRTNTSPPWIPYNQRDRRLRQSLPTVPWSRTKRRKSHLAEVRAELTPTTPQRVTEHRVGGQSNTLLP
jgi:hypothetical protein